MYTILVIFKPVYYLSIILGTSPISNSGSEKFRRSFLLTIYSVVLAGGSAYFSIELYLILAPYFFKNKASLVSELGLILTYAVSEIHYFMATVMSWVFCRKLMRVVSNLLTYNRIFCNPKFISKKYYCLYMIIISFGFIYLLLLHVTDIYTHRKKPLNLTLKNIIRTILYWVWLLFPYLILIQFASIVILYGCFFTYINEELLELIKCWDSTVHPSLVSSQYSSFLKNLILYLFPPEYSIDTGGMSVSLHSKHYIHGHVKKHCTAQLSYHSNFFNSNRKKYINLSSGVASVDSVPLDKFSSVLSNRNHRLVLSVIMKLHGSLCDELNEVNATFSIQLLIGTAERFVTLTLSIFFIFLPFYNKVNVPLHTGTIPIFLLTFAWSLVNLMITVYSCSSCSSKANRTAILVHKLLNKTKDPAVREELQLFSLQLLHRKVKFTACGFFPLDFTLLYSIIGAVTTYLVILIQFQLSFANAPAGRNDTTSPTTTYDPGYFNLTSPNTSS